MTDLLSSPSLALLEPIVLVAYIVTVAALSAFGFHRLVLMVLYFRHRDRAMALPEPLADELCPHVLVQLPVFNERFVVQRLLDSVCAMDWPRDRLHLQLLDDSTDDTLEVSQAACAAWRARGIDVELVTRADRTGFKAGALQAGLKRSSAPFVAIFDADFLPPTDFLRRIMPPLVEDEGLGMVQGRWGHINRGHSLLTRAQAILLDGHFVMEHGARFRAGRFFNFNGTAGVWRRQAIDDAGGWEGDTLTEDLDLSYRSQLAGWRFAYLQALEVPAELPEDPRGFKNQQHRWAKGSIQTARKLLPRIWRSDQPLENKIEATFHMANNLAYPFMVVLLLLLPVALVLRAGDGLWIGLAVDLPVFLLATANLMAFYALSEREVDRSSWLKRSVLVPFVLGLGASLTANNARAVWEALRGHRSPFVRTPKGGGQTAARRYRPRLGLQPFVETAWGLYYGAAAVFAAWAGLWVSLPFLVLFSAAFLLLGVGSLLPQIKPARLEAPGAPAGHTPATAPSPAVPTAPRPTARSTPGTRAAAGR